MKLSLPAFFCHVLIEIPQKLVFFSPFPPIPHIGGFHAIFCISVLFLSPHHVGVPLKSQVTYGEKAGEGGEVADDVG